MNNAPIHPMVYNTLKRAKWPNQSSLVKIEAPPSTITTQVLGVEKKGGCRNMPHGPQALLIFLPFIEGYNRPMAWA